MLTVFYKADTANCQGKLLRNRQKDARKQKLQAFAQGELTLRFALCSDVLHPCRALIADSLWLTIRQSPVSTSAASLPKIRAVTEVSDRKALPSRALSSSLAPTSRLLPCRYPEDLKGPSGYRPRALRSLPVRHPRHAAPPCQLQCWPGRPFHWRRFRGVR